jgi:hypothetical protein
MVPRLIHNRPGSGVLRECLAQVRYVAAAPPARKKAIVGKSRVAATRLQGELPGPPRDAWSWFMTLTPPPILGN